MGGNSTLAANAMAGAFSAGADMLLHVENGFCSAPPQISAEQSLI